MNTTVLDRVSLEPDDAPIFGLGTDFAYRAGDLFVRPVAHIADPHIARDDAEATLDRALLGLEVGRGG